MDMNQLTDASLDISRIVCECKVWTSRRNHRTGGLATFRGHYHPGSAGEDDARHIRWKLKEFYDLYRIDGIVVDCRGLDYSWGDDLDFVEREPHRAESFPMLIVVLPEQQDAYAYVISRDKLRYDLISALNEVDESIRAMQSLL